MAKYHFEGQAFNEKILLMLRRHPLVLISNVIFLFVMIVIGTIVYIIFPIIVEDMAGEPWRTLWDLLAVVSMMFIWVSFFIIFIDYYLDVWIVTSARIVDIEQKGLFRREVASLDLGKIQDISMTQEGIIPTFFNYGNVTIQTAGSVPHFIFKQIRKPQQVKRLITRAAKEAERNRRKKRVANNTTPDNTVTNNTPVEDNSNFDFQ